MKTIELLDYLQKVAKEYSADAKASIIRNNHMNMINENEPPNQIIIDAVLVDFINFIAAKNGVDYGFNTSDLTESLN